MDDVSFSQLLEAIPGPNPAGLQQDDPAILGEYTRIDAMQATLRQWQGTVKTARYNRTDDPPPHDYTWQGLLELLTDFMQKRSKDVRLLDRLFTAATHVHGFDGYRGALDIATDLVRRYGVELPSDGRSFQRFLRLAVKSAANTSVADAIEDIEVGDGIRRLQVRARIIEPDAFRAAISPEERLRIIGQIEACQCSYQTFRASVQELIDSPTEMEALDRESDAPALTALKDYVIDLQSPVQAESGDNTTEKAVEASPAFGVDAPAPTTTEYLDRRSAIAAIKKIAAYFRKTEPHSPLSYGLYRMAEWADMDLPQLLQQILEDAASEKEALDRFLKRAGVPKHNNFVGPESTD